MLPDKTSPPDRTVEPEALRVQSETLLPTYQVRDLLQNATEIGLLLDGALYRLRVTRQGKLILTK